MSERFDVVVVGSGRGRRRGRRRARAARALGAAARARPLPHGRRLPRAGRRMPPTTLVADPLRDAGRRVGPGSGRADRRPLRRRLDDDQHEGRDARRRGRPRASGTRRAACSARHGEPFAAPTSTRTTSASSATSASACATTGPTASAPSSAASTRSARASRRSISYTDDTCMRCGSCLQGCPTNAGKSTQNTWIQRGVVRHGLTLRAGCAVERVVIEDGEATGRRVRSTPRRAPRGRRRRGRRRGRDAQHAGPARALGRSRTRWSGATSASTRRGSCSASSTSTRTRTWSTRSPRTAPTAAATTTAASSSRRSRCRTRSASSTTLDRRERPDVGRAARRGGAQLPPLDRACS